MLAEREQLNKDLLEILDAQTDSWGIKIANVELKQADLNETMVRAIQVGRGRAPAPRQGDRCGGRVAGAREAAANRPSLGQGPEAMQLRYLGTLLNIAGKRSSTINFAVPMDLGLP